MVMCIWVSSSSCLCFCGRVIRRRFPRCDVGYGLRCAEIQMDRSGASFSVVRRISFGRGGGYHPSPGTYGVSEYFRSLLCSKSLQISFKVHWFLMAELEDTEDNEGISRIQEKCQIAATLMGEWPPLICPQSSVVNPPASLGSSKSYPVLNRLLSSKRKLLSLASSPSPGSSPPQEDSNSGTSSSASNVNSKVSSPSEENKLLKKLIPGPKVRESFFFKKSMEKDEEDSDKDGFFHRLLRDSKDKDDDDTDKDGFFKRLLRDSKDEEEELNSSSDGFFKRL